MIWKVLPEQPGIARTLIFFLSRSNACWCINLRPKTCWPSYFLAVALKSRRPFSTSFTRKVVCGVFLAKIDTSSGSSLRESYLLLTFWRLILHRWVAEARAGKMACLQSQNDRRNWDWHKHADRTFLAGNSSLSPCFSGDPFCTQPAGKMNGVWKKSKGWM